MNDLTGWALSVDRRALVMRALETSSAFNAPGIASRSGRSMQDIGRDLNELEERTPSNASLLRGLPGSVPINPDEKDRPRRSRGHRADRMDRRAP